MMDTVEQWREEANAERQLEMDALDYRTASEKAREITGAMCNSTHQRQFNNSADYEQSMNEDQRKVFTHLDTLQSLRSMMLSSRMCSCSRRMEESGLPTVHSNHFELSAQALEASVR